MENELREIHTTFQSGKHKQAIADLQDLLEKFPTDDRLYKAYDLLGDYFNFMGQHVEAVEAWTNALKFLENNDGTVDKLDEEKLLDWINISIGLARVAHRQGKDGSGVSHKYNSVCYASSKMNETEETEWKIQRFQIAIKHFKRAIDQIPQNNSDTKRKIQTELANVLFDARNFDEAVKIYENAFNNDGDAEWLYKAANCSWQQGNKEQAYVRLQQLIITEPTFSKAYQMCANYFKEKEDTIQADEYTHQYQFYSWIPSFCRHIQYNSENILLIETIQSNQALECVQTTFGTDMSKRSTEFLAAICYHHYHGPIEDKAFELLETRGKVCEGDEKDFIGSTLINLIKNQQSICTIKGAANALAGMKYTGTFEILKNLLPQDLNVFFPMHIPMSLAKLGDQRAIPLLIKIIEKPIKIENDDSDSSDRFFLSEGTSRLVIESCLALSTFINDPQVKDVLLNGLNREDIHEMCLAVLSVSTEEKQFFDELEKMLAEGNTLNYMVVQYFKDHVEKSQYIDKLLKLNEDIHKNKIDENCNYND